MYTLHWYQKWDFKKFERGIIYFLKFHSRESEQEEFKKRYLAKNKIVKMKSDGWREKQKKVLEDCKRTWKTVFKKKIKKATDGKSKKTLLGKKDKTKF